MNRYKVEYTHVGCHPETCSHWFNYRVIDTKNNTMVEEGDDREELEGKYKQLNKINNG